ncbi:hypothetical protein CK203_031873 [Vitis vinifera]|uniref:Uncharacterized protein n=1 Tax=Vitis vinifera TaxID=29760 RepID=A0A438INA8_VITVI|nr:hypothetical protein CK203_031873 [Vitis vinifera]
MGVRDSNGVSKGGKCWFAVESKAFEISVEEVRGKLRGTIWERSKGLSSWIRFGEKGLSLLLKGVEAWCKGESNSKLLKVWDEGARKFRLECRSNVAGRFLLCSVRDVERKKFCLVFLEGNGLVGGKREMMCREEQLRRCLVGCFGGSPESIPSLPSLKRWAYESWLLKGELRISRLGGALVLFEFQNKWEADMDFLFIFGVGRFSSVLEIVVGGFVAVDEETTLFSQLQWARILVKDSGMKWPGSMQVEAGNSRWELCLWWEATPRVMQAVSCSWMQMRSEWEVRDEGGEPHALNLEEPVSSRASPEAVGTLAELEQELLVVGSVSGMEPSLGHLKPTDDALLDEASMDWLGLWKKQGAGSLRCEERLVDISVHEDRNLSPRVTGGEASGPDLAIVPLEGFRKPISGDGGPSGGSGGRRGRMELQLPCEIQSLLGNADSWETKIKDMSTGIVRSLGALYSMMESGGLSMFPSERIWRARVPPKVAFFAWEASWGKVLTQEQLQRRGFSLANSEDNPSWVEWRVCGKKTQEGLANGAFMYFLGFPSRESFFSCKFCKLDRLLVREGGVYTPCILRGHRFRLGPISGESTAWLDRPFSEEAVRLAVFQLNKGKAPDPDGFTIAAYQEC